MGIKPWIVAVLIGTGLILSGCGPNDVKPGISLAFEPGGFGADIQAILDGPLPVTTRYQFEKIAGVPDATGTSISRVVTTEPVRFAEVAAINAADQEIQIGRSFTNANGDVTLNVPRSTAFTLLLKASTVGSGGPNIEVKDSPQTNKLYTIETINRETGASFTSSANSLSLTITVPPIPLAPSASGLRGSAIFNILDAGVRASATVATVRSPLEALTFFWSPAVTFGSFFTDITSATFTGPAVFINGGDSNLNNTDEFDDFVMFHEYGHFVASRVSVDRSLGGEHVFPDDTLYPSLAYSEGLANAFAGIVTGSSFLTESSGITGTAPLGVIVNLEDTPRSLPFGIRSEASVTEVIWDIVDGVQGRTDRDNDGVGLAFGALFTALTTMKIQVGLYPSLPDLLTTLISTSVISQGGVNTLLAGSGSPPPRDQLLRLPPTGTDVFPTVVTVGATVSDTCTTVPESGASTGQDVANRFFKLVLDAATAITVTLTHQGFAGTNATGSNLDLLVFKPDNTLATTTAGAALTPQATSNPSRPEGVVESGSGTLAAGTYIIYVSGIARDTQGNLTNVSANPVPYTLTVTTP